MYIPKTFQETDLPILHEVMQTHNFATMVGTGANGLIATHLPLMIDPTRGTYGTLIGHMARANDHAKALASGQEMLVIFQGVHTYISASWYEDVVKNVPTWNYVVVHAYGIPSVITDQNTVHDMLKDLAHHHETEAQTTWEMNLPADYEASMHQSIVAFELPITRLEGKFKLSQNRSETDQHRVIDQLLASDHAHDHAVGTLMHQRKNAV